MKEMANEESRQAWLEQVLSSLPQGARLLDAGAGELRGSPSRGLSSAASAANGLIDHVHDLVNPTLEGEWRSVCVCSDGSYGVAEGLISSFPVRSNGDGTWEIIQGLELDEFLRERLDATAAELSEERELVSDLLVPSV